MGFRHSICLLLLLGLGCSDSQTPSTQQPASMQAPLSMLEEGSTEETNSAGETTSIVVAAEESISENSRSTRTRSTFQPSRFTKDDFEKHLAALKKKTPSGDFLVHVEYPFVIIGDEEPSVVKQRAVRTVRWAATLLKKDFFRTDPKDIVDIWLFKDKISYDKHAKALTGRVPHTPFGFYSPRHKALIMNISTGGGTLVHEMVHPFVAADFPQCPSWLNEGLGSLFEQCSERDGKIHGLTNWRLRGLQRAIRDKTVPSFETLCSTTSDEFYNADPGTNYSQARYLCYYLQQQGLLRKYYKQFRANHRQDPTGYQTLQEVLDVEDMDQFKKTWEASVQKLRFPS